MKANFPLVRTDKSLIEAFVPLLAAAAAASFGSESGKDCGDGESV